jgi:hypothetical protein
MKSKLVPIVDADIIVYRCGLANASQTEPLSYTLHSVKQTLEGILSNFEPSDRTRVLLQGQGNYRNQVATVLEYKGNRDPSKRPQYFDEIRDYLAEYQCAEFVHGMETDDAIGIEQWSNKDRSTCIVTIDKDLDCIPGWHYNYVNAELYYIDLATANQKFWRQVLTGDSTDNILGCGIRKEGVYKSGAKKGQTRVKREGVGPQEAQAIVEAAGNKWADQHLAVLRQYEKHFGKENGYAMFHENATLIWIQREYMKNYDGSVIDESGRNRDSTTEESATQDDGTGANSE